MGKIDKKQVLKKKHSKHSSETRITLARITTLVLSIGAIAAFAQALKGVGGYLFDKGSPALIIGGLGGGLLCAIAALKLWKYYLSLIEAEEK